MLLSKGLPSIGHYTHQEPATVLRGFLHVMAVLMCVQGQLKLSVDSEKHLSTARKHVCTWRVLFLGNVLTLQQWI